jgi:hypothetical protein
MTIYSNPRMSATIEGWPSGSKRVTAKFLVEVNKRGQRATRVTTGEPKWGTYSDCVRIVDGDDGKTYIASWSRQWGHINIMRGDMKYEHETIYAIDPRYSAVLALLVGEL